MKPFTPAPGATLSISAASAGSTRTAVKQVPTGAYQVRLHNAGPSTVFWSWGDGSVAATTGDIPLPSGAIEVITLPNRAASPVTHIAAITSSSTATLYVTTGQGL